MEFSDPVAEIRQIIQNLASSEPIYQEQVLETFEDIRAKFDESHRPSGIYYPCAVDVRSLDPLLDTYAIAAAFLERHGAFPLAEDLYSRCWDAFSGYQLDSNQYVYKAGIAMQLVGHYLNRGDAATAFRWALLTQVDDVLNSDWRGGGGRVHLQTIFGLDSIEIDRLNKLVSRKREHVIQTRAWANALSFPEDIVRELMEADANYLLRWGASSHEFKLSKAYYKALLHQVRVAETNEDKGNSLESLASYVISLLPGCVARRNVRDFDLVGESDLVVHNLSPAANLFSELLGRNFIVECKNWAKDSVGTSQVGYFLHRMQLAHTTFGIIFARSDISGGDTKNNASYALIRRTYHETGHLCVIINENDLDQLSKQDNPSIWKLLLKKIEEFRFGNPLSSA